MENEASRLNGRSMDARRDTEAFRERIYEPALVPIENRFIPDNKRTIDR